MASKKVKTIYNRIDSFYENILHTMEAEEIALLSVTKNGKIFKEVHIGRGDYVQVDTSKVLAPWFKKLKNRKLDYFDVPTLHNDIHIYSPVDMSDTDVLLEYLTLSGIVTLQTGIERLIPTEKRLDLRNFNTLHYALNGENNAYLTNIIIDFKYGIIVSSNNARLSHPDSGSGLAVYPILEIKRKYKLFVDQQEQLGRHRPHVDLEKAKQLAYEHLKKCFFV